MTVRNDFTVDTTISPRVVTVASPETSINIQDIVDTLREWEDELINLEQPKILDASGKEDLGGGLSLVVTVKLLNARFAFEARPGPTWVQCEVFGGNLTAVDDVGDPIDAIETTAFTQVLQTSASSSIAVA